MFGPPLAGRYLLRRELGSGAYARVFLADDQKLSRAVAVKVLNDESASSQEAVQRLEREGRVSAGISHPNVCGVYDIGRLDNGTPFLVMEHLTGETLANRMVRESKLPVAIAVDFAEQILLGLYAAHRRGVVHRDLKPANVFIVDLGLGRHQLKLLDFGTAYFTGAASQADATLTRAGLVVGTPEYMSPEQLRGLRDFDARTDVYACGVLLYQMLTGRRPFQGLPSDQLSQAIAFKQAPPIATVAPTPIPPAIAWAVDTALMLNPSRRHVDAAAFLSALREVAVREALPTAAVKALPRARPPSIPDDWDLATDRSGPPSAFDPLLRTSPMSAPVVHNIPSSGPPTDIDSEETIQPTRPRRR
jgi:eukaryotic-like serine/threonine-protein kinase